MSVVLKFNPDGSPAIFMAREDDFYAVFLLDPYNSKYLENSIPDAFTGKNLYETTTKSNSDYLQMCYKLTFSVRINNYCCY